ncbi:MAG: SEL1-like repeat protein [Alphaproteobacteria bacterium]|nr:SEL1-like repeat protein [Alphaproteobacteria bacterium]
MLLFKLKSRINVLRLLLVSSTLGSLAVKASDNDNPLQPKYFSSKIQAVSFNSQPFPRQHTWDQKEKERFKEGEERSDEFFHNKLSSLASKKIKGKEEHKYVYEVSSQDDRSLLISEEENEARVLLQPPDSPLSSVTGPIENQEAFLQARIKLFQSHLKAVKEKLQDPPPVVFLSYSREDSYPQMKAKSLAEDLVRAGVPYENVLLDQWSNRPGSGGNVFAHADKVAEAKKVILIGSPELKDKYTKGEGLITQEINTLRNRIIERRTDGIIPVWFEDSYEMNFPAGLQSLQARSLVGDYCSKFFDLLVDIYQLHPVKNEVNKIQEDFLRRASKISEGILKSYASNLQKVHQEIAEEDENVILSMLSLDDSFEAELLENLRTSLNPGRITEGSSTHMSSSPFSQSRSHADLQDSQKVQAPSSRVWNAVIDKTPLHSLPDRPEGFIESYPKGSSKSYLTMLEETFLPLDTLAFSAPPHIAALAGMGGLGKTTLALQYAYEALDHKAYDIIYWLPSETDDSLEKGYKALLADVEAPLKGNEDTERIITLIRRHIPPKGKRCLLVYDNVLLPTFLDNKKPQKEVDILITSRHKGWGKSLVALDVFRPEDSIKYLLTTTGIEPNEKNKLNAEALAEELGHLPLALSHAAGYIKYVGKANPSETLKCYLEDFRKQPEAYFEGTEDFLNEQQPIDMSYERLITKSWSLSGREISPLGHQLMLYFAYLNSEAIPEDIFLSCAGSKKSLQEALAQLDNFSLIKKGKGFLSIHRLLQLVIRKEQKTTHEIVSKVCDLFLGRAEALFQTNFNEFEARESAFNYLPHIIALLKHGERLKLASQQICKLECIGKVLWNIGFIISTSLTGDRNIEDKNKPLKHMLEQAKLSFNDLKTEYDETAFHSLLEVFHKSHPCVKYTIGNLFFYGIWLSQDYKGCDQQGNPTSQLNIGFLDQYTLYGKPEYEKALEWYTKATDQGYAEAQVNLGKMYEKGHGVAPDNKKACELYKRAANQKFASGQYKLGLMHAQGLGVEQSYEEGLKWCRLAAEQGHIEARTMLGWTDKNNQGLDQTPEEALKLFNRAVARLKVERQENHKEAIKKRSHPVGSYPTFFYGLLRKSNWSCILQ